MPHMLYVGLHDDDKIAAFALEGDSGELTKQLDVPAAGGLSADFWAVGQAIRPARYDLGVRCAKPVAPARLFSSRSR
jgi:hypothetical protein